MYHVSADELLNTLEEQLNAVDCEGTFWAHEHLSNDIHPGLRIAGIGGLGLPLYDRDIQALKQAARQSPFGKGESTIIDTSIRNTWQIDAENVSFAHPAWEKQERAVLDEICTSLGVYGGPDNVRAEFYKLLIYEEGAFLKPHKDSEKTPGMFATMVISLPSLHQGGDVVVTLQDESKTLATAAHSAWKSSALAWYADVTHEVRPVEKGTRVVLTYNLVYTATYRVPDSGVLDRYKMGIRDTLKTWKTGLKKEQEDLPKYIAYPFEHEYSQANLRLANLKRKDRDVTRCMETLVDELDMYCFLAIFERSVVERDDDSMSEVMGNDGPIMEVTVLSQCGRPFLRQIDLPQSIMTNRNVWDDRLKREEERSTGNEGVERTLWYKTCGILLVTSKNWIDLNLSSELKISHRTSYIKDQLDDIKSRIPGYRWLARRICKRVCETGFAASWPGSRYYEKGFVVDLISRYVEMDVLEDLAFGLQYATPSVAAVAIESLRPYLGTCGLEKLDICLRTALSRLDGIAKRVETLHALESIASEANLSEEFAEWKSSQILEFVSLPLGNINTAVPTLVDLVSTSADSSDLIDEAIRMLMDCGNPRLTFLFANQLLERATRTNKPTRSAAVEMYKQLTPELIAGINFLNREANDNSEKQLTALNLTNLCADLSAMDCVKSLHTLHQSLALQAEKMDPSILKTVLVPYLKEALKTGTGKNSLQDSSVRQFCTHVLANFVYRYVGHEPKPPNLVRDPHGCGCPFCRQIDTFLASPDEPSIGLTVPCTNDVSHLEWHFGWGLVPGLKTKSEKYSKPYKIQITKTRNAYDKDHSSWLERRDEAQPLINDVAEPPTLRQILGHIFAELAQFHGVTLLRQPNGELVEPFKYMHESIQQSDSPTGQTASVPDEMEVDASESLEQEPSKTPSVRYNLRSKRSGSHASD